MITKLHHTTFLFLFSLVFNSIALSGQTEVQEISLQETLPPLVCEAPIDPNWLEQAAERSISAKTFDKPIVRVAYLIPSNRTPQPRGVEALQLVVRKGLDFFKQEMTYNGHLPKTFRYETEADGETPLIQVVHIPETDAEIEGSSPIAHWSNMINSARNLGLTIWNRGEIWILVSESHRQQQDGSIMAGGALGAGGGNADDAGVATMTSTFLTPFAEGALTNDQPYDSKIIPEIGPYPLRQGISFSSFNGSTLSSIASVTLGAFLHELNHAFGVGHHDFRNDRNFKGNLMGNGFRGIRGHLYPERYPENYTRLAYATALALNTSHYFNEGKERNKVDELSFYLQSLAPQNGNLVFNVSASDADGLSMLQLFGTSASSVEKVLEGIDFSGPIHLPYYEPGQQNTFRLILYDKQGNKTYRDFTVIPQPGNRAPWPYVNITPPIGEAGSTFGLHWEGSFDPDTGSGVNSNWDVTWDLNNDGIFDVVPQAGSPMTEVELPAGNHLVRLKLTEPSGASTISTPVAVHVS
ncbi:MAG: hypothetical protein KJN76_10925, partial [Eudoraea sp.]|nr:hypothetical protein [Eudoraea sp.]